MTPSAHNLIERLRGLGSNSSLVRHERGGWGVKQFIRDHCAGPRFGQNERKDAKCAGSDTPFSSGPRFGMRYLSSFDLNRDRRRVSAWVDFNIQNLMEML